MSKLPSSSDSNSPKKPSFSGNTPKEGTEHDLWDFDSDDDHAGSQVAPDPEEKTEPATEPVSLPSRRVTDSPILSKKPTERHIDPPTVEEDEPLEPAPAKKEVSAKTESEPAETSGKEQDSPDDSESQVEENTPSNAPTSWKTIAATLTKAEKIGISALIAIFAVGATLSILHFSNRVPIKSILGENLDFPIEGKHVNVTALDTYWREPVTTGDDPDVVRRGTKLIPVLKISAGAKSAVIRVLFRNEDGSIIGDPINRTIKGKTELLISATAGFDDIGMHAAYRTGESPPWIVQILEASESGLSIDKFDLVLETEISTDVR